MELLILLFLSILMCFFFNSIFRFNRTVFVLLSSVLVFLFVSFFIIFLGFEFLGLVFATIYVGGIVVMFLFLILIVDVRVENTKKLVFKNNDFSFTFFLSLIFTFFSSLIFMYNYFPLLGNNLSFYLFFNEAQLEICKSEILDLYLFQNKMTGTLDHFIIGDKIKVYSEDYVLDTIFGNSSFDEIYILGVVFFQQHSLLLCLAGLFLLIATIVAVILCLNIFN